MLERNRSLESADETLVPKVRIADALAQTLLDAVPANTERQEKNTLAGILAHGLSMRSPATLFPNMTLQTQKVSKAMNGYQADDSLAIVTCFQDAARPITDPHYILASSLAAPDLSVLNEVIDHDFIVDAGLSNKFSMMQLPPALDRYYRLQEHFMDIAAAGVLATRSQAATGEVERPYKAHEVAEALTAPDGGRMQFFRSPAMYAGLTAVVASVGDSEMLNMMAFSARGDVADVRAHFETKNSANWGIESKRALGQIVLMPLTDSDRQTLEELFASTIALMRSPCRPVDGELVF